MISFSQVCKRYPGGYEALKNVSFEIAEGEMVFIHGHSGAGKSTLLNLAAAIGRPTSGSIVIRGQNIGRIKDAAIPFLRRNLGLVFQDHKLLFDRSVLDNVLLPLDICGFSRRECFSRARAALDKVGLREREKSNPIALSGGEQQRLCIARAFVNRPAIVLADEPTANLDADSAREIMEILKSFHQVGVTLLLATHDEIFSHELATRVLVLRQGELAQPDSARQQA